MSETPTISVLLPIYNDAEFVRQSMDCILGQTFGDFELLATDDGSSDETLQILNEYADRDQRVVVHSRENRGLVYSLNEGLDRARGTFIARMDADDWSYPERFERQLKFLKDNPQVGVVGSSVSVIGHQGDRFDYHYPSGDQELRALMYFQPPFSHSVVMYRRSVLDESGIRYSEDHKHAEDYDIYERLSRVCELANLPEILHKVRARPDGVSETHQDESRVNRIRVIRRIFDHAGVPADDRDLRAAMGYDAGPEALQRGVNLFNQMLRLAPEAQRAALGDGLFLRFARLILTRYGLAGFRRYWSSEVRRYGSRGMVTDLALMAKAALRSAKNVVRRVT